MGKNKTVTAKRLRFNPESPITSEVAAAYSRLRKTFKDPRSRLDWAVRLAGNIRELSKNDLAARNTKAELYAFIGACGLPVPASFIISWPGFDKREGTPDSNRAYRVVLRRWEKSIGSVINREQVRVITKNVSTVLSWSSKKKRYVESTCFEDDLDTLADRALTALLLRYGHLVKQCPAPRLQNGSTTPCESWFVAKRTNNLYCSPQCQSRATTYRKRDSQIP